MHGFGHLGWLPLILTALAIFDIFRNGRAWWWALIVLFMQPVGAIAYFVITRGPWAARGVPDEREARRAGAAHRLAALEVRLAHWRGPALLVESAEELLSLRRYKEAEERFREARAAGASVTDVNMGLAETLVALKRTSDAVSMVRELVAVEPDFRLGAAALLLARCLDEVGPPAEAETAWRRVLEKRQLPEARARLARQLVLRGETTEGLSLANEVVTDVDAMTKRMAAQHLPWRRLAKNLASGRTKLPRVPQDRTGSSKVALTLAGAIVIAGVGAWLVVPPWLAERSAVRLGERHELAAEASAMLAALDAAHPSRVAGDSASIVNNEDIDRWIRTRRTSSSAVTLARAARAVAVEVPGWRRMLNPYESLERAVAMRADAMSVLASALAAEDMGPTELERLGVLIDARFLEREEALPLALPRALRHDCVNVGTSDPRCAALRAMARKELQPLEDSTRALLESRRAELEALSARELPALVDLLTP